MSWSIREIPPYAATGGIESTIFSDEGVFRLYSFKTVGSFTFTVLTQADFEYLVVGGGGAGGRSSQDSGGGGAGGFRTGFLTLTPGAYTVTVGDGGAIGGVNQSGNSGQPSSFHTIESAGGGFGANFYQVGGNGGSGGGSGGYSGLPTVGLGNVPAVSPPQGYDGGYGEPAGGQWYSKGGGGGGAGGPGENWQSSRSGNGGPGRLSTITGQPLYYAGGGGGGNWQQTMGAGGIGGGGGGNTSDPALYNGAPNTGGGGSGEYVQIRTAGKGGSGVVYVRYPLIV